MRIELKHQGTRTGSTMLRFGLAMAVAASGGCGPSERVGTNLPSGSFRQELSGVLRLPLRSQVNGVNYQLTATFVAEGPELRTFATNASPGTAASLTEELVTGTYTLLMQPGFELSAEIEGTFEPVAATLLSANPQIVEITAGGSTQVTYRFEVAGGIVELQTGNLEVDFEVDVADTLPDALDLSVAATVDRRGGLVQLGWSAVGDTEGAALSQYFLRCAATPITTESAWSAAQVQTITQAPAAPGSAESFVLGGFHLNEVRHCALRARDALGAVTPLGATAQVSLEFLTQALTVTAPLAEAAYPRSGVVPLGDVNGDGAGDFASAAVGSALELFFGQTTAGAPATLPAVTILAAGTGQMLGSNIAALGDINGDGLSDFAVGTAAFEAATPGEVLVFYGRPSWPGTVTLTAGCHADLCLTGAADDNAFGSALSGGDFDGDGSGDLIVGSAFSNGFVGRTYVLRGGGGSGLSAASNANLNAPNGTSLTVESASLSGFLLNPPGNATFYFGASVAMPTRQGPLVIGAPDDLETSRVLMVNGRAHQGSGLVLIDDESDYQTLVSGGPIEYGGTVRPAGDINGDGLNDLILTRSASVGGRAEVYLNSATGFASGQPLLYTNNQQGTGRFYGFFIGSGYSPGLGTTTQAWSNLDGDTAGTSDVMLGAIGRFANAVLFHTTLPAASKTFEDAAIDLESATGQAMLPNFVGDVTGDGYPDVAVLDLDTATPSTSDPDDDATQAIVTVLY